MATGQNRLSTRFREPGTDPVSLQTPFWKILYLLHVSSLISSAEVVNVPASHDKRRKLPFAQCLLYNLGLQNGGQWVWRLCNMLEYLRQAFYREGICHRKTGPRNNWSAGPEFSSKIGPKEYVLGRRAKDLGFKVWV